ncbi:4'-phosphopantetheinyl transferase family protein [Streptomyces tendae]|uniref:hypothetical protein n=1 Tax=Streptomyces tendae TaxID=1932 RepID=UPI0036B7E21F
MRFSVAHAPGLAVCLVCPELDCGVDVEVTGRPADPVRVARTMFHPREAARVLAAPRPASAAACSCGTGR